MSNTSSRRAAVVAAAAALLAPAVAGCGSGRGSVPAPLLSEALQPAVTRGAEPTGGTWRPFVRVAGGATALTVPPPPAPGSMAAAAERSELHALAAGRTAQTEEAVRFWEAGACRRWNEIARDLVARTRTPPPRAARVYALVSIAQYEALIAAWDAKYRYNRSAPNAIGVGEIVPLVPPVPDPAYPSEHAAVASASAAVLAYLYPAESDALQNRAREHAESRLWAGVNVRSDVSAGAQVGGAAAQSIIAHARTDRADDPFDGAVPPTGEGAWTGRDPLLPSWGNVTPYLMERGDQFRPAARLRFAGVPNRACRGANHLRQAN